MFWMLVDTEREVRRGNERERGKGEKGRREWRGSRLGEGHKLSLCGTPIKPQNETFTSYVDKGHKSPEVSNC